MKKDITIYDAEGRMMASTSIDTDSPPPTAPGGSLANYVEGIYDVLTYYVVSGMAVPRPENPAQLTGTTLFNIQLPAQIQIGNDRYSCTDSTMELDLPPGSYEVIVISFPCKPAYFTVIAP